MDDVFDALSYVRRHTSNAQVLLICDTLSRLLLRQGNTVADMSQVRAVRPIPAPECPVCAARKANAAAQKPPQSKGKRTKAKKRKRPVAHQGPRGNNAPAASPEASPIVPSTTNP